MASSLGKITESDTEKLAEEGLMDVDMDFSHNNLTALGIDNDALDINDLMDDNILRSILPDSPPDSGSEQCHLSPHYSLSPPGHGHPDMTTVTLYNDPVLYQDGTNDIDIRGQYDISDTTMSTSYIPDISNVDYDQPLQIIESAQVVSPMYPQPIRGDQMSPPMRSQVIGVNNNSLGHMVYRENNSIKQEPLGSPTDNKPCKPVVNKRKKRGASDNVDTLCDVSAVKIKTESSETEQILHFTPFQPSKWRETYNSDYQILKTPVLKVTADKGFNYSQVDDAFIAQKKNHFQLSCHVTNDGDHFAVSTDMGYKKVEYLQLNFYGVKKEAPEQKIQIEQSQTDRSRKKFFPIKVNLNGKQPISLTEGRLHFSETTLNNMRKKGKPNPEQKYFILVVALEAVYLHNNTQMELPLCTLATDKIIVRASNPGLFEPEQEVSWSKNPNNDTVYHLGKVGIGTDTSKEALTVQGNIQVAGNVLSPSDVRLKQNIREVDTKQQLQNLKNIQVVEFNYRPEYLATFSDEEKVALKRRQVGVIAQDVGKIIPDAVESTGDVTLRDGKQVNNMLIVNKDRLFLENIGAVRELTKVTDNLGNRIDELETHTVRMSHLTKFGSIKSTGSQSSNSSRYKSSGRGCRRREGSIFRNKWIQGAILCLVGIMTVCLLAMAILYILDYQRRSEEDSGDDRDITDIFSNTSHTISPHDVGLITTRSTARHVLTTIRPGRVTTTRSLPTLVTTTVSTHKGRVPGIHPPPIGRPHDCPAPGAESVCETFCCQDIINREASFRDHVDNNISSPGGETMNYEIDDDNDNSVTPENEPNVVNEVSNILEVTEPRHTSEHTRVVNLVDTVQHVDIAPDLDTSEVEPAVQGAVEDRTMSGSNADNNVIESAGQSFKTVNFVSDQRVEVGRENLKENHDTLGGRLPRNQRNFQEAANNVNNSDNEVVDDSDKNEIENEVDPGEDNSNSTHNMSIEEEENRSGTVFGKNKIKLPTSNELINRRQKKNSQDNLIEDFDTGARKSVVDIIQNLRRKRNVNNLSNRKQSHPCSVASSQMRIRTSSGVFNISEQYCSNCHSSEANCSYSIPLSKYLPDIFIGVIFINPVVQCDTIVPSELCPLVNDVDISGYQDTPVPPSNNDHQVNIEVHRVSHHRFRMLRDTFSLNNSNLCQETRQDSFIEFNIKFYRACNG